MLKQLLRLCFELVKRFPTSTVPAIPVRRPRRALRRAGTRVLVAAAELSSPARELDQAWLLPRSHRRLALTPNIVDLTRLPSCAQHRCRRLGGRRSTGSG